jgi:hypothetical protein
VDQVHRFQNTDGEAFQRDFFSMRKRIILCDNILLRLKIRQNGQDAMPLGIITASDDAMMLTAGLRHLVHRKIYEKAYPLHDGPVEQKKDGDQCTRVKLMKNWAGKWYTPQPMDTIRAYFGEKIAFYYAWLGFYTQMLLFAGLLGAGAFAFGVYKAITYVLLYSIIMLIAVKPTARST